MSYQRCLTRAHGSRLERSGAEWTRPEQVEQMGPEQVEQTGPEQVEQSRAEPRRTELERGYASGPPCSSVIPQTCCFIIELFALNTVSFFTTPHIGDS